MEDQNHNIERASEPKKKKRKRSVVGIVILSMIISSLATVTVLSTVGAKTPWITVLGKSQSQRYYEFNKDYGDLLQIKDFIEENYYIVPEDEDLKVGIYKGLFEGLNDPYSTYLTPKEMENSQIATSGKYEGIGVSIGPDENGYINVVAPIEDTPAEKAGILAGDKIIKIDGKEYSGNTLEEAVSVMRGEPGSTVKITILRGKSILEFDIKRAAVTMKSIKSEVLKDNIGYIRIISFDEDTAKDFKSALTALENQKVSGLVIDLRGNPGGLVDKSVEIADMLIDTGLIIYTQDQKGKKTDYNGTPGKTDLEYTVLIDKGSASASEILSAAIKDHKAGTLIGTVSYGKGIIQQMIPLNDGSGIKLTIAQYFSPNGSVIHKKGVEPDIKVELTEADFKDGKLIEGHDKQLNKAVEELKK